MPRRNLFLNRKYLAIQKKNQRRRIRLNDLSVEVVTNRVTGEPVADELLLNESVLNEPSTHDLLLDEPLLDEPLLDEPLLDEPTSTDDSETDDENSELVDSDTISVDTFKNDLTNWALRGRIPHNQLSRLLKLLKKYDPICTTNLPTDSRSLLSTPRTVSIIDMVPGKYFHFGLQVGNKLTLKSLKTTRDSISLLLFVDGCSISKSTNSQMWPIVCSILHRDR